MKINEDTRTTKCMIMIEIVTIISTTMKIKIDVELASDPFTRMRARINHKDLGLFQVTHTDLNMHIVDHTITGHKTSSHPDSVKTQITVLE